MSDFPSGEAAVQLALAFEGKAERFAHEADEWIEANPDAWAYIVQQATRSAAMGRKFSVRQLAEYVRWHFQVNRGRSEFSLNNNWTSAFARRLGKEHPELLPYMNMRHSVHEG